MATLSPTLVASILQHVADGIVVRDTTGHIIYANEIAARLTGYASPEELMAAAPNEVLEKFEVLDEAGQPIPVERLPGRRALRGQATPETIIHYYDPQSGEDRWSLVAGVPILGADGAVEAVVSSFRDITREVLARQRAEAASARQAFLANASQVLAGSLDYETRVAAVARLVVPDIADWCSVDLLDDDGVLRRVAVAHADPAKVELAWELGRRYPPDEYRPRALATGEPELIEEITDALLEAATPDLELRRIVRELGLRSSMTVPLIARGRTLGVLTLVSAESGHEYGREDLAFAQELASHAALAIDNARLHQDLERALGTRDEFLAAVSHDLRNPLQALKGVAQVIQMRLARDGAVDPTRLVAAMASIYSATDRMAGMIDNLMDVARMHMGRPLELERRPTDLAALARQIARDVQQGTSRHRIEVAADEELVGMWDSVRLQRVLGNLLDNAVKYSPQGGDITVTLAAADDEAAWAVLQVQDGGVGIPEADLPRIFERFRRGSNVIGRFSGTGIGLASVRQIVEQHGGSIAIESREGDGTTITIRLPLGEDPGDDLPSPRPSSTAA